MNQKNIFTVIGVVLILQGVAFLTMCTKVAANAFPTLDEAGNNAVAVVISVIGMLFILVGLISIAAKNTPTVLWAYTLGFGWLCLLTLKHYFIDHINVPLPAMIIQILTFLACGYLWMKSRNTANRSVDKSRFFFCWYQVFNLQ